MQWNTFRRYAAVVLGECGTTHHVSSHHAMKVTPVCGFHVVALLPTSLLSHSQVRCCLTYQFGSFDLVQYMILFQNAF